MIFSINTLIDNGTGMKYNTKEEFMNELSMMIDDCITNGGTCFNIAVNSDATCFYKDESNIEPISLDDVPSISNNLNDNEYVTFTDIKDGIAKLEDLLNPEFIHTSELAVKKADIMPQEVPDNLPSAEEYQKRSEKYAKEYIDVTMRQYSEPRYLCPTCQAGGMCRDEHLTLLSYPPKYKYVCNKCGYIDYKSI